MRRLFDLDKWQEIFSSLTKHKLRTGLTALGVIWGIFMLIVMMGAGTALENGSMHEFGKWSVKSLFVWTERTTVPYHGLQAGRFVPLYMDDIKAVENRIQGIDLISPRLWLDVDKIIRENKEGAFSVRGETEALVKIDIRFRKRERLLEEGGYGGGNGSGCRYGRVHILRRLDQLALKVFAIEQQISDIHSGCPAVGRLPDQVIARSYLLGWRVGDSLAGCVVHG